MSAARSYAVVALVALGVVLVPGGGAGANTFGAALFVVLTVGLVLLAGRMYLENRVALDGLGDRHRALLYGGAALLVLALAAGPRLFETGLGSVLWVAMLGAAVYAFVLVVRHVRSY